MAKFKVTPATIAAIDRALRGTKPHKGYPRPKRDPIAQYQTPPTWTYAVFTPGWAKR